MSEAKLWIEVMRASSGQEPRKYVSRNAEYDSGLWDARDLADTHSVAVSAVLTVGRDTMKKKES